MFIIIIIGIVVFLIYVSSKSSSSANIQKNLKSSNYTQSVPASKKNSIPSSPEKNIKKISPMKSVDEGIIEVSKLNLNLKIENPELKKYQDGVPAWKHQYVYSHSELEKATNEQKEFYYKFKNAFLIGEYFDLEGNNNYCFILLFDLLNKYSFHNDIIKLEEQLTILGSCYPRTNSYAFSFLADKMRLVGDYTGAERVSGKRFTGSTTSSNNYDYDYWRLGSKFKKALNLKEKDVILLNSVWFSQNNFSSIEFCCREIVRLFLDVLNVIDEKCKEDGTSLKLEFEIVGDLVARKHHRYKLNSSNYKYALTSTTNEIYSYIFKVCENALRDYFGHKRKISADFQYTHKEILNEFDIRVISRINTFIPQVINKVQIPDDATEIKLNSQNTSRWKIKFEQLKSEFRTEYAKSFADSIVKLGELNKLNPSVENIFYEASKFMSKHDKEIALSLYVYYVYYDLNSASIDNKQLAKTIQKSLFQTDDQLAQFEGLINTYIADRNLEKALQGVSLIYSQKRKRIKLDSDSISQARERHTETVMLLNEYLKDESDDNLDSFPLANQTEEISLNISQPKSIENVESGIGEVELKAPQFELLQLFRKGGYVIPQEEVSSFAKSRGMFKNQLVESINDSCYEILDDVLIEEEDENYIINEAYYEKIFRND